MKLQTLSAITVFASALASGCLPDPISDFTGANKGPRGEEIAASDDGEAFDEDEPATTSDYPNYAVTEFIFDENKTPLGHGFETTGYGENEFSIICLESPQGSEALGSIKIKIQGTASGDTTDEPEISMIKRLDIFCPGKIEFRYYDYKEGLDYQVKFEHLDLDKAVTKTATSSFSTLDPNASKPIKFELDYSVSGS